MVRYPTSFDAHVSHASLSDGQRPAIRNALNQDWKFSPLLSSQLRQQPNIRPAHIRRPIKMQWTQLEEAFPSQLLRRTALVSQVDMLGDAEAGHEVV